MTAVTWLLILSIFGTWLVSMLCLTVVTAQDLYDKLYEESEAFLGTVAGFGRLDEYYNESAFLYGQQYEKPDRWEYDLLRAIRYSEASYDTAGDRMLFDLAALRLTGYFEGTRFIPVSVHYMTKTLAHQAAESSEEFVTRSSGTESVVTYTLSGLDRAGLLDWQLQFDCSGDYDGDRELVTVYTDELALLDCEGEPLGFRGTEYANLNELTVAQDFPGWLAKPYSMDGTGTETLRELLVFGGRRYYDLRGYDPASGGEPEVELYVVTAARSAPLACAVGALRNVYIVTGLLVLVLFLATRGSIRRRLVEPVAAVTRAVENGWPNVCRPEGTPKPWPEAEKLIAGYAAERDRRRGKDNEITRLNTALDYAKTAEENRRQMTSHIAHELKTPLAVIHSYAEGLKEKIAEEKRERYLDVILAESEHMDAMVLEMLDLSRLEAGKVKLSRDEVSLEEVARDVLERLDRAVGERGLQVECDFSRGSLVTADRARIGQVVENFIGNAVKYTTEGGHILVRTRPVGRSGKLTFSVENDCPPIPPEKLSCLWDTFYRGEGSGGRPGSGLGLAIARQIVELHGGTCSAYATQTGLGFSFTIG